MKYSFPLFLIIFFSACSTRQPYKTGFEGEIIPHFNLLLLDSTSYFNTSHIRPGKAAVFVYFGPYCIYSRAETESIVGGIEKMGKIRFYFITNESFNSIKEFSKLYDLDQFPNIAIGRDYANFFEERFNISAVPTTLIYNKEGKLAAVFQGQIGPEEIMKYANG